MKRVRSQKGFSLIELLIVVSIALIIAGFAVPQFMQALRNFRIAGDARSIDGEILLAKMRAASNFTWGRVLFNFDRRTFVSQTWDKTNHVWVSVNVGGPQPLSTGVQYGIGSQTLEPAFPPTVAIASDLAPTCKAGNNATPPNGNPGLGANVPNTACIMFNSRGFPVDNSGGATPRAIYVTDGIQVHGVTVSITGLTAVWRADNSTADNWIRH
jgi:prepilin-type N-terminal cleavage/methylation domain-containing protein